MSEAAALDTHAEGFHDELEPSLTREIPASSECGYSWPATP